MKTLRTLACLLATLTLTIPAAGAAALDTAPPAVDGPALFERLKTLVGEWQGTWTPGDVETRVTYRLTGNGSALAEEYLVGSTTMSTLYHLDGEELMLTHYCSVGNQPRMRATTVSPDGSEVLFEQFDVTNVTEGRGYSERLTLTLVDSDDISVFYRGSRTGKSSGVELKRVNR